MTVPELSFLEMDEATGAIFEVDLFLEPEDQDLLEAAEEEVGKIGFAVEEWRLIESTRPSTAIHPEGDTHYYW